MYKLTKKVIYKNIIIIILLNIKFMDAKVNIIIRPIKWGFVQYPYCMFT